MRFAPIVAVGLVCVAYSAPQGEARRSQSEAQAIAEVERLSTPPAIPVRPQPITFADLEKYDLFGAGCYFLDGKGDKAPMLFLASDEKGWMKIEGEMTGFSADRSSSELPYLSWSKYVGLARTVELERDSAAARSTGPETETAPGTITVRDARDQVVFKRSGLIDCGA
jgi:hypothetical protein